jgi:hypothetical protein
MFTSVLLLSHAHNSDWGCVHSVLNPQLCHTNTYENKHHKCCSGLPISSAVLTDSKPQLLLNCSRPYTVFPISNEASHTAIVILASMQFTRGRVEHLSTTGAKIRGYETSACKQQFRVTTNKEKIVQDET